MKPPIRPLRGRPHAAVHLSLATLLAALPVPAQAPTAVGPTTTAPSDTSAEPVAGARPGTELWVVHFTPGRLDLAPLRRAHLAGTASTAVADTVAGLDRTMRERQRAFVTAAEALGARVLRQWWLVDACELEATPADLALLRAHPDVARVEPVVRVYPVIRTSTNDANHAADRVHRDHGVHGAGVTVAIIDTGVDDDMNGTGRPHRAFFPGGDAGDTSGGGLQGSRLSVSRQIGLLGPDDPHGHGTGVASIAVGGGWGSAQADAGHADRALLCSYAVADEPVRGGTTTANLAQAWQQVAADRSAFGIAVANLSYSGSSAPSSVDQRALDSAARNADVLVTVAAGNTGTAGSFSSQSAANGLAVGAVANDVHTVADFSTRGPLANSERFYPDLAACGVGTVMAKRDAETADYVASGTSMAAPQVAGAAALCRSAAPHWSALETKAALLASAADIAHRNPGLDRNAFGVGFLRDDLAVELALGRQGAVGRGLLDANTPTWSRQFAVQDDSAYAVAITWHRDPGPNDAWSDLALQVVDDQGRVLASSDTPQNLYENLRFVVRDPLVRSVTVQVRLATLQPGTTAQDFGWAFTPVTGLTLRGEYRTMARGCAGSGPPDTGRDCIEHNTDGPYVDGLDQIGFEIAYAVTAPDADLRILGFERHGRLERAQFGDSLPARVYARAADGKPGALLASGTLTGTTTDGWQRATLDAPLDLPAGTPFFVAVENRRDSFPTLREPFDIGGEPIGWSLRLVGSSSWVLGSDIPFAVRVLCDTTARQTIPTLTSATEPAIGQVLDLRMSQVPLNAAVAICTGISASRFGAFTLPLDLAPLGAPGCLLRTSIDYTDAFTADAQGRLRAPLRLPNDADLVGRTFYQQAAVLDPAANALALTLSDAAEVLVGGRMR